MYRKNKNILSSSLINVNNIKKIHIKYDCMPEIIFTKEIDSFSSSLNNEYEYNQYKINYSDNSFYNKTLIWIEQSTYKIDNHFSKISEPIFIISLSQRPRIADIFGL